MLELLWGGTLLVDVVALAGTEGGVHLVGGDIHRFHIAEIHAHHSDLVEFAQHNNVWLVSPTTMMAILTTARAVLKDVATRKQVHEIQKHLRMLGDDFERFQLRMDNLAKRIAQAHSDAEQVHISSRKISQRFTQIDKADLDGIETDGPILIPAAASPAES